MSISEPLPACSSGGSQAAEQARAVPPMRVNYDISILGYGHVHGSGGRTGIYRVVEELAYQLAASPRCQLSFFAMECAPEAQQYLAEIPHWDGYMLPAVKDSQRLRAALKKINKGMRADNKALALSYRLARKPVHLLYRCLTNADYPLSPLGDLSEYDIFHATTSGIPASLRRYKSLACFQTIYDMIPLMFDDVVIDDQKQLMRLMLKNLAQGNWALAISQSTKNDLCSLTGMDPARVFVTPLAADRERFYPCTDAARIDDVRARYGIPPGRYLLSVCTLEPRKNLDTLIRCFARVVSEPGMEDCALVLTGNVGWKNEKIYAALAEMPALKDKIILTGFVADADLAALYSGAVAFAYPSLYEGFGLPPLEAMQCGTPVLTSNTSSLPEVVGDAGIMAAPRDEDALCQGILDLCQNAALRANLSARSLVRAAEFSWERCATQTMDAYATASATH